MSNIHGLGAVKKETKTDGKTEEFTTSGATSSTSVLRPTSTANRPTGSPSSGLVGDIMSQARATSSSSSPSTGSSSSLPITIYSNGFIIGTQNRPEDFRDLSIPANKKFLEEIRSGYVPKELQDMSGAFLPGTKEMGVQIIDRSKDVFTPPKVEKKYDFAAGKGQSLVNDASSNSGSPSAFSHARPEKVVVDSSHPTTVLQLVLHPRQRLKETFNQSHTVLQLYQHIQALSGVEKFELLSGFPPKPLNNPTITIKDAGLIGASVQQKV